MADRAGWRSSGRQLDSGRPIPAQRILYGLSLTALFEEILTVVVPRWRRPLLILTTT